MVYDIKKYGSEVLRGKNEPVEELTDEIKEILDNMKETMAAANGVGLAAPQIGINKRFFVCMLGEGNIKKIINPVITPLSDEKITFEEGCLSIPGIYKSVDRYSKIKLNYTDENGKSMELELEDYQAVVVQHEYDHLEGILFVDKISPVAKKMVSKKLAMLKKNSLKAEKG
ncbi:peptide deformylase [Fusobacterium sp. PH5-44]|uniref:peptide deformylase n=1 Tax=unclassified Fusobacterium TaxID=2648384 RepID=UPI003D1FC697